VYDYTNLEAQHNTGSNSVLIMISERTMKLVINKEDKAQP
jgi:hypothetical protein